MARQPSSNKILAMDQEHLREIDGVVLDLDSYARHTGPVQTPEPPAQPPAAHAPVFLTEPQHAGWYKTPDAIPYPIMAGALPPQQSVVNYVFSIGSGSYATSYHTSFFTATSWLTSYYGSGSWGISSWGASCSAFQPGGFGLELI